MKVVILCGGLGTRIKEETDFKPKPMIKVGTRPILWHIMKIFSHYGYNDFILPLGYKGDMIKEYFYNYEAMNSDFSLTLGSPDTIKFYNNHSEIGWKVTLVDTGTSALKGARIKRVEGFIDSASFILTYGDGLADIDIKELVKFHKGHGRIATVTGVHPPSRFGELVVESSLVKNFSEKPQTSCGYINGGFFIFKRDALGYLQDRDDCDLEYGLLEKLSEKGELMMYRHGGFWQCMDNLRDMEYLNKLWEGNSAPWKIWQ